MRLEPTGMEVDGIEITLEEYESITIRVENITVEFRGTVMHVHRGADYASTDINKMMDEIKDIKSEKVQS